MTVDLQKLNSTLGVWASAIWVTLSRAVNIITGHLVLTTTLFVMVLSIYSIFLAPLRIGNIDIIGQDNIDYPYNSTVLAYAIRDRVNMAFEKARIDQRNVIHIEVGEPQPIKVDLPNQKFSVTQLTDFLRDVFHVEPQEITGTLARIFPNGKLSVNNESESLRRYRLTLRKTGKTATLFDTYGPIESLIDGAAVSIIEETEPAIAANYVRNLGPSMQAEAIAKAQRAVKLTDLSIDSPTTKMDNRARQSWLVLGYALGDDQQFSESDKAFERAMIGGDGDYSVRSYDGRAYVRIQAAQGAGKSEKAKLLTEADGLLEEALAIKSNYDSALFHNAEIMSIRSHDAINTQGCAAKPIYDETSALFGAVIKQKSDFSIAYAKDAVLWLDFMNYIQNEHKLNCSQDLSKLQQEVVQRAEAAFQNAARFDIESGSNWLQWALLTFQRAQLEPEINRSAFFDRSIEKNIRAVKLLPTDSFSVRRLHEALIELEKIRTNQKLNGVDEYFRSGISTFCEAFPLRSWPDESERIYVEQSYKRWCKSPRDARTRGEAGN